MGFCREFAERVAIATREQSRELWGVRGCVSSEATASVRVITLAAHMMMGSCEKRRVGFIVNEPPFAAQRCDCCAIKKMVLRCDVVSQRQLVFPYVPAPEATA